MKRLLCIIGGVGAGGAETMLMKLYRQVDRSKYQFDFYTLYGEKGFYEPEIKSLGGTVYTDGNISFFKNPIKRMYTIYQYVKLKQYKYILLSTEKPYNVQYLLAAKLAGAKVLAVRSTNSTAMKGKLVDFISRNFQWMVRSLTNVRFAPSELAADFMFGENSVNKHNVRILHNGLDITKFRFCQNYREEIRREFNIEDKFVVGNVGRFYPQKNHEFQIKVFAEIAKCKPNAVLLLIGKGVLKDNIVEQAKILCIEDKIIFAGIRNDVNKCLMAMDIMVFPSFYEGMPNVVIEAQATGLPCIVSNTVTSECKITGIVKFASLANDEKMWADIALNSWNVDSKRENYAKHVSDAGYDIKDVANEFVSRIFYEI